MAQIDAAKGLAAKGLRECRIETGPVTLEGRRVRLEPLGRHHLDGLCAAGLGGGVFRWFPQVVEDRAEMEGFVAQALAAQQAGTAVPFATVARAGGAVVGSTRFGNIDPANRRVEIGWTWLAPAWQRTALNTEAKLLMLAHAFEVWGCLRVELKTDANNHASQRAIERLGAVREGVFRKHMVCSGGRLRDTVWYSIVDDEWPAVRARLEDRLARG